jgi:hypothetical protein
MIDARPVIASSGPALRWRFDEPEGNLALDASGNGRTGAYIGENGMPAPTSDVPMVMFPDAYSRGFTLGQRHAVQLSPLPDALKPAIDVTLTVWYRATAVDTNPPPDGGVVVPTGSELVSAGNQFLLRLRPTQVEFSKRVMATATTGAFSQCFATVDNHLDGNWHHLAGVSSAEGIKVYFDGVERCTSDVANAQKPIFYDQGRDLWVGRHGNGQTQWDFGGNIDDVRVYTRALPADEIAFLARGGE